ncbi:MAG: sialate O-acetylesterase [Planctomycetota bacterium]
MPPTLPSVLAALSPTLLVPLLLGTPARADVRLPSLFSDGMVLQRDSLAPIWGWAAPGERVSLRAGWNERLTIQAEAGADGAWSTAVPTGAAGGPYTLRIEGASTIEIRDVLIGEVWLGSGQSNMEWKIQDCARGIEDFAAVRAEQNLPRIRLFDVRNAIAMAPVEECAGTWRACTPESWPELGAVAFYFARELHRELSVPIGVITSDWGGTPAEAWTSRETLASFPEFAPALARLAAGGAAERVLAEEQAAWWRGVDEKTPGAVGWAAAELDDSEWPAATVPAIWSSEDGLDRFDGVAWYRRTIELPAGWTNRDLVLELGPIDDMDTTWFNGEKVGGAEVMGFWSQPRSYRVSGRLVRRGANTIAVRVVDTGGHGGFTGAPDQVAVRLAGAEGAPRPGGAPSLSIAGAWRRKVGASLADLGPFPSTGWFDSSYPTSLYNGMIAPLVPYRLRGVIWYQGESNRERAAQYRTLFPALIADWRGSWEQGELPFYFVQIAPYRYEGDTGEAAELREAQMLALQVPQTGMAVTMDIGEPGDIHPANKWEVGRRLALWALAQDYGRPDLPFSGPLFRAMAREGARIRLSFDHTFGGLMAQAGPLSHFTIAGADRLFHRAQAEIEGNEVVVWGEAVGQPVAVRYGWGAADMPNLFNLAGLPASSFRTDDWER